MIETALRAFAETAAGLRPIGVFDIESPLCYPALDTGVRALNSSGVSARAIENSGEAAVSQAHRDALTPFRQADGSYRVGATLHCLVARP